MNIEEIKNTLREFQAENGWKIKNTQADFKKVVSYIKKKVYAPASKHRANKSIVKITRSKWKKKFKNLNRAQSAGNPW